MKTVYKKYFYDKIKDYSNMPHYETCPLPKVYIKPHLNNICFIWLMSSLFAPQEKYWIKDYPFDADKFKGIAKPGYYRVEVYLLQGGVAKTGVFVYGSATAQS